jgi:hypothetical protein
MSGKTVSVYGELMGALIDKNIYYPDDTFRIICEKSHDNTLLSDFLRYLVGKCYVIIESTNEILIFTSASSPGLYYTKYIDNKIILSEDESYIYQHADLDKLDEIELLNMIISHQGLIRMPFTTPFNNIKRVIGGCSLTIDKYLKTTHDLYLLKSKKELNKIKDSDYNSYYKDFSHLLESTLKLITDYYEQNNIFLAKSGGIDSSILLAALTKIKTKFLPVHLPYGGTNSLPERTASTLCKLFNTKLEIIPLSSQIDHEQLIIDNKRKGKQGLGSIIGAQYLKVNPKKYFHEKTGGAEANVITGQNLDSLYFIDTFAPSSNSTGLDRFFGIISTIKYRIYFSNLFLGKFKQKWLLSFWPFSVTRAKILKNFTEYLSSFLSPVYEHVVPLHGDNLLSNELSTIENKYYLFKKNKLIEPILELYETKCETTINFDKLSINEKNHLIRISKWCRFIHNTHSNYHNLRKADGINRITPFSEGPLATYFLTYQLTLKDVFYIKRICHRYFYDNSGVKFYQIASKYRANILLISARHLYMLGLSIPTIKGFLISLKNKLVIHKDSLIENHNAIHLLNIIKKQHFEWDAFISTTEVLNYIKIRDDIIENKLEITEKAKVMELSRLVNLELFLSNCIDTHKMD